MPEFFEWFFKLLYRLQKDICEVIEFIQSIFFKVGGIEDLDINGEKQDLLIFILRSEAVWYSFLGISLIGFILLFIFTAISSLKNNAGFVEQPKTKSQVFVSSIKGFIQILLVPILLFAFIYFASAIIKSLLEIIGIAIGQDIGKYSIGARMLICVGENAWIGGDNREIIEKMFISGTLSYKDVDVVGQYYNFSDMNLLIGVFGPLILAIFLIRGVLTVIRRVIDTTFLYLFAPIVGSTYPLDDGLRFGTWRSLVISKSIGAFGIIFIANITFYIMPIIISINFVNNSIFNGLILILFYISAGILISQGDVIVSRLLGTEQTKQTNLKEHITNFMAYGITLAHAGKRLAGAGALILGGKNLKDNIRSNGLSGAYINNLKNKNARLRQQQQEGNKQGRRYNFALHSREAIVSLMEQGIIGSMKKRGNNHDIHNT